VETRGIEPRTYSMRRNRATTVPYPPTYHRKASPFMYSVYRWTNRLRPALSIKQSIEWVIKFLCSRLRVRMNEMYQSLSMNCRNSILIFCRGGVG
jgi:hypothetical protein